MGETTRDQRNAAGAPPAQARPARAVATSAEASADCPLISCPSCSRKFRRRRPVVRRSSAECPACKRQIWMDPFQRLYPGQLCLSEEQAQHVVFLMRLGDMWCGAELLKYLDAVRASLTTPSGAAPSAGEVLQRLLTVARGRCVDPDEEQALRELTRDFKRFQRKLRRPDRGSWSPASLRRLLHIGKSHRCQAGG